MPGPLTCRSGGRVRFDFSGIGRWELALQLCFTNTAFTTQDVAAWAHQGLGSVATHPPSIQHRKISSARSMLAAKLRHDPVEDINWQDLDELLDAKCRLIQERRKLKTHYDELLSSLADGFQGQCNEMTDRLAEIEGQIDDLERRGYKRDAGRSSGQGVPPPIVLPKTRSAVGYGLATWDGVAAGPSAGNVCVSSAHLAADNGSAAKRIKIAESDLEQDARRAAYRALAAVSDVVRLLGRCTFLGPSASEAGDGRITARLPALSDGE